MKYILTVLLLVLAYVSPGFSSDAVSEKIRIGVDPHYPPFSEIDKNNQLKGFDIDIALACCTKMEVDCVFVQQNWDGLIPELQAGQFDAIVSSMSINEERREFVAFTNRYYSNIVKFVAHKDSEFDPHNPNGTIIGVAPSTVSAKWLEENLSDRVTIRYLTQQDSQFEVLTKGQIDALFGDSLGFWHWLQGPQGTDYEFKGEGYRIDEGIGIAVRKDDNNLLGRFNHAIEQILADGTYETINSRYFPFSIY